MILLFRIVVLLLGLFRVVLFVLFNMMLKVFLFFDKLFFRIGIDICWLVIFGLNVIVVGVVIVVKFLLVVVLFDWVM